MQLGFYSAYFTDVTPITLVDLDGNRRHTLQYTATHQNMLTSEAMAFNLPKRKFGSDFQLRSCHKIKILKVVKADQFSFVASKNCPTLEAVKRKMQSFYKEVR